MVAERAQTPSRLRILIADDFPQAAEGLAKWFSALGFTVQTAYDGAQALEAAERFSPQIMILDIEMPKLTGYEVAERVRQTPWGKNIVLVAFTALRSGEHRLRAQRAGFDDNLVKPVAFSEITSLVRDKWQQISVRKASAIAVSPNQEDVKRAFELARSAFERVRQVERRGRHPRQMMRPPDSGDEYEWWSSINHQTRIERDSAYREFGEAQKSFANLLTLHIKTSNRQREYRLS